MTFTFIEKNAKSSARPDLFVASVIPFTGSMSQAGADPGLRLALPTVWWVMSDRQTSLDGQAARCYLSEATRWQQLAARTGAKEQPNSTTNLHEEVLTLATQQTTSWRYGDESRGKDTAAPDKRDAGSVSTKNSGATRAEKAPAASSRNLTISSWLSSWPRRCHRDLLFCFRSPGRATSTRSCRDLFPEPPS